MREQTASNKKAYPLDPGLVSAVGFSFSPNRGRLLQTLVAIACFRHQLRGVLLLTDAEEGAARERWQGHEAEVRRQPVWKWLMAQG